MAEFTNAGMTTNWDEVLAPIIAAPIPSKKRVRVDARKKAGKAVNGKAPKSRKQSTRARHQRSGVKVGRKRRLVALDLYCGAGGIDHSLVEWCEANNVELELTCVNHWDKAIATNQLNHPRARHLCMDVEKLDLVTLFPDGYLDLLILAPQCIYFTKARGGKPVTDQMRADAWYAMTVIQTLKVRTIVLENVPEFEDWGPTVKTRVTRNITFQHPLPKWKTFLRKYQQAHGGYRSEWKRVYHFLNHLPIRKWKSTVNVGKIKQPVKLTIDAPDRKHKGIIFSAWKAAMIAHGFKAEHQIMNSADYGGFTSRKRFFLIAERASTKIKIKFPLPTHTPTGKANLLGTTKKYRAASEIIDWTNLGTSIWARERAIVYNTWRRVLAGLEKCSHITFLGVDGDEQPRTPDEIVGMMMKREAGTTARPFLISLRGTSESALDGSNFPVDEPAPTLTGGNHVYVVNPLVLAIRGGEDGYTRAASVDDPLGSPTTSNPTAVITPTLEPFGVPFFGEYDGKTPRHHSLTEPLPNPTSHGAGAVVSPQLIPMVMGQQSGATARAVTGTIPSPTTDGGIRLMQPYLMPVHHGVGDLRVEDVHKPMTSPTTVDGKAVVNSFMFSLEHTQNNPTDAIISPADSFPTITNTDAFALANAFLATYHDERGGHARVTPLTEPMPPQDTSNRHALTMPYLVEFHQRGEGVKPVTVPLGTQTSKDRFALINPIVVKTADGRLWLFDILMRMLTPRELARAMSFPDDFQFVGSREDIVKQIGNAIEGIVGYRLIDSALRPHYPLQKKARQAGKANGRSNGNGKHG